MKTVEGSTASNMARWGRAHWFEIASTSAIVFLSVVLVLLILQNLRYKGMLEQVGAIQEENVLKPGERVEDIAITTLGGEPGRLNVASSNDRYLIFVLSTSCPHCLSNLPKWADINRRAGSSGLYVVGLSVQGPKETSDYIRANGVQFYTVTTPDSAFLERARLPGVPATLLVSTGGIVRGVWIGELTDQQVSEVIDQAL